MLFMHEVVELFSSFFICFDKLDDFVGVISSVYGLGL